MIPGNNKLHNYFEAALESNADKIYLQSSLKEITYKELFSQAESYKEVFVKFGIEHSDRVVIYSSKNEFSIACMIACSMCNCIYVPIAISNPAERAAYIIEETGARIIMCDKDASAEIKKAKINTQLIYSDSNIYFYGSHKSMEYNIDSSAAFILYTSGSTGHPKGVVISHTAAIAFINWAGDAFDIDSSDKLSSIAPFNFDLSVFDIYVTASKAATLVLFTDEETKNALLMAQKLSKDKVSTIYATPTFYSALAYYGRLSKYEFTHLKRVLFAGEVFLMQHFNELIAHWPDKKYINLYGPTETNVCTYFEVNLNGMNSEYFPIGKCCPYSGFQILNKNSKEITGTNVKGELCISGDSLFIEYWNDKLKTKNSIYTASKNTRYYRTGDIVYLNEEMQLVYVGRKDKMVKKNGYRIEPAEIEQVVAQFNNISSTAIIFDSEKNQIVCFIEPVDSSEIDSTDVRAFCIKMLPLYMIPDKFVILTRMPTTVSGKIDLQELNSMNS